jgi:hypothetical protein
MALRAALLVASLLLGLLVALPASSKKAPPPVCTGGRFLVQGSRLFD